MTAIDLRRRLELSDRPADQLPLNVVVQTDDGAVSLLVDEIGDVLEVPANLFERAPETLQGPAPRVDLRRLQIARLFAAYSRHRSDGECDRVWSFTTCEGRLTSELVAFERGTF